MIKKSSRLIAASRDLSRSSCFAAISDMSSSAAVVKCTRYPLVQAATPIAESKCCLADAGWPDEDDVALLLDER
jgi:hypothetical protein